MNDLNRARKLAGLPLVESKINESVSFMDEAVKHVLDMAAEKAEKRNGEVDTDGIDDFLAECVSEVGSELLKAARKANKENN